MTHRELRRAKDDIDNAGSPEERQAMVASYKYRAENDLKRIQNEKSGIVVAFRRFIRNWRTREVSENLPVCADPDDEHNHRIYLYKGLTALAGEIGLAIWFFVNREIWWIWGAVSAIILTVLIDVGLHFIFRLGTTSRPKEPVDQLRRIAKWTFVVFGFATIVGVFGRVVSGETALHFLPVLDVSLVIGSLCLMLIAGCLLAAADVFGTTGRHSRKNRKLEQREDANHSFLQWLERHGAPIVLLAALLFSACAPASSSPEKNLPDGIADLQESPHVGQLDHVEISSELHIIVDASGSPVDLATIWERFRTEELLDIVKIHRCEAVCVFVFDVDGWNMKLLARIVLPRWSPPENNEIKSEWRRFKHIRQAAAQAAARRTNELQEQFQVAIEKELAAVEDIDIVPPPGHETSSTDVVGVLQRVSQLQADKRILTVLITDLADTRVVDFPDIPKPVGEVSVIVLLATAAAKDAEMTLGKVASPAEQFQIRARQLERAAPWVTIVPHFTLGIAELFNMAPTEPKDDDQHVKLFDDDKTNTLP